jgi:hypothetical protein
MIKFCSGAKTYSDSNYSPPWIASYSDLHFAAHPVHKRDELIR